MPQDTRAHYEDTCSALAICLTANVPVLLWGPPGVGKSTVIHETCTQLGLHCETIIASLCEPSDFAGLPIVDQTSTPPSAVMAPPGWATRLAALPTGEGVQFFDEVSTASPSVQAALLRPVLDKRVGDLQLPQGIRTVAAANPTAIAADGWDLKPPMANRFCHLEWDLPASIVADGFSIGWPKVTLSAPDPAVGDKALIDVKRTMAAFFMRRSELVNNVPTTDAEAGRAFPTPRSWEAAAKVYAVAIGTRANANTIRIVVAGCIGDTAAHEFLTYLHHLDLPDPEALLADPDAYAVPSDRGDLVYAIAASVSFAATNHKSPERWNAWGMILAKTAEAQHADVAYTFARRWAMPENRPDNAFNIDPWVQQQLLPIMQSLNLVA